MIIFIIPDTWILYRNGDVGVSKVVCDAFSNYMKMGVKRENEPKIRLFGLKSSTEFDVKLTNTPENVTSGCNFNIAIIVKKNIFMYTFIKIFSALLQKKKPFFFSLLSQKDFLNKET